MSLDYAAIAEVVITPEHTTIITTLLREVNILGQRAAEVAVGDHCHSHIVTSHCLFYVTLHYGKMMVDTAEGIVSVVNTRCRRGHWQSIIEEMIGCLRWRCRRQFTRRLTYIYWFGYVGW